MTARDLPDLPEVEEARLVEALEARVREELGAPAAPAPATMEEVEAAPELAAAPVEAGLEAGCPAGTTGSTATPGAAG